MKTKTADNQTINSCLAYPDPVQSGQNKRNEKNILYW